MAWGKCDGITDNWVLCFDLHNDTKASFEKTKTIVLMKCHLTHAGLWNTRSVTSVIALSLRSVRSHWIISWELIERCGVMMLIINRFRKELKNRLKNDLITPVAYKAPWHKANAIQWDPRGIRNDVGLPVNKQLDELLPNRIITAAILLSLLAHCLSPKSIVCVGIGITAMRSNGAPGYELTVANVCAFETHIHYSIFIATIAMDFTTWIEAHGCC